jgi:mycofactocin precursor
MEAEMTTEIRDHRSALAGEAAEAARAASPSGEPADENPEGEPSEEELIEDEVLVEEISIDGMCGVY